MRPLADAASINQAIPCDEGPLRLALAAAPPNRLFGRKGNDTTTQLDPLDRDGRLLDHLARNSFEFCFCR